MNTFLSTAQESQLQQYRSFADEHVRPVAGALAEHATCLKEFLQKLAQYGYLGLNAPKEYGGQGGGLLDVALFCEAIGRYDAGLALTIGDHAAVIELVKRYGQQSHQSLYLPGLARGEGFGSLAFAEENAGTDFRAVESHVDNGTLSGKKLWVVTGDFATVFAVLAKQGEQLCLQLVERTVDSFKLLGERRLMGLRSAYINDVEFAGASAQPDMCLAGGEQAAEAALHGMAVAKVLLAAGALGLIEEATELALDHAKQRQQFGTAISSFQGVQWKLADMGVDLVGSRLQVYRAAWSHEHDPQNFQRYAAMCKYVAARAARFHSGEALQILGASGLAEDGLPARFYDDAKVMEIAQGTQEFQKMLLVKELNI